MTTNRDCVPFAELEDEIKDLVVKRKFAIPNLAEIVAPVMDKYIQKLADVGVIVNRDSVHWSGYEKYGTGVAFITDEFDLERFVVQYQGRYVDSYYDYLARACKNSRVVTTTMIDPESYDKQQIFIYYHNPYTDACSGWKYDESGLYHPTQGEVEQWHLHESAFRMLDLEIYKYFRSLVAAWYDELCQVPVLDSQRDFYTDFFMSSGVLFDRTTGDECDPTNLADVLDPSL